MKNTLTVFTPTYNRAHTLPRLYESLCGQSLKDFEWLVIDDGSTDGTEHLIKQFLEEKKIVIHYIKQENGGKNKAINRGVSEAKGELFFIVDSDDFLVSDALDMILSAWGKVVVDNSNLGGLCFRRKSYIENKIIGPKFPYQTFVSSTLNVIFKHGVVGDKAEIFVTEILKEYPFPIIQNEKFIPEGYIWNRLTRKYPLFFIDDAIYMCEYLDDGISRNLKNYFKHSPKGFALYYKDILKYKEVPLIDKIKAMIRFFQMKYYTHCNTKS